ncbi:MAG TPA: SusC/RagA family TonB-linked outer membrane protein, partial [Puia sp.]
DVDWYNEVMKKTTMISNYNLNLSGGNNDVRYFVDLNLLNNNGLFQDNSVAAKNGMNSVYYRNYNFRSNLDINLSKRLTATFNLSGAITDKSNEAAATTAPVFANLDAIAPNEFPVYNPDGTYGGSGLHANPKGDLIETGLYSTNAKALSVNLKLTEQLDMITKGLSISAAGAFNNFSRSISTKTRQYERYALAKDSAGNASYNKFGQKTSLAGTETSDAQWQNYSIQGYLNYDRTFGPHEINAMLMYSTTVYSASGVSDDFKHKGTAGRFTYNYLKKYIAEFSFGHIGSENFPDGKRYGFFPAGSLAWIVSNEGFLKGNNTLSYLKIRGSYGLTGNDNIGGQRFPFYSYYTSVPAYYLGTNNAATTAIGEGITPNPDVTWEREKQLNLGIEGTLFKQLEFSLDWFKKDRYDILATPYRDVPLYLGLNLPTLNVGKVTNKGLEAMLRFNSKETGAFQYFIEANVWVARNKIEYNSEAYQTNSYLYRTGHPIGQPFLLQATGFFKDQADIDASPKQVFDNVRPGDIKYKDQNNDGVINANDMYPIGKTDLPELTATLQAGVKYKGLYLNFLLWGVSGRSVYLGSNYFKAFQNNGKISSFALNRWTPETAETANYPRLSSVNNLNNFQPSSFWQRNGDFLKLRSIELGYNLTPAMFRKIGIDHARVFVNGNNLFSIDGANYTDLEIMTGTGYPAVRTISVGANLFF